MCTPECYENRIQQQPKVSGQSSPISRLTSIISDVVQGNFASKKVQVERLTACLSCEFRVNLISGRKDNHIGKLDQCSECSCFIKVKSKLENEKCPASKWGTSAVNSGSQE